MVVCNPCGSNQSSTWKIFMFERALLVKVWPAWPTRGGGCSRYKRPVGSQLPAGSSGM